MLSEKKVKEELLQQLRNLKEYSNRMSVEPSEKTETDILVTSSYISCISSILESYFVVETLKYVFGSNINSIKERSLLIDNLINKVFLEDTHDNRN